MKSFSNFVAITVFILIHTACSYFSKEQRVISVLKAEVKQLENEITPRLEDIAKLQKEIEHKYNLLDAREDLALQEHYRHLSQKLSNANDNVLHWSRNYKISDSTDLQRQQEYLQKERSKIKAVRAELLEAIELAQASL